MEYTLPNISNEQNQVIDNIKLNNNIIVDAVAGSGKTTTILHICKNFPNKNILVITYNARLKLDTRMKVQKLDIKNTEIHSYHGFCTKYYISPCINDIQILKMLEKNPPSKTKIVFDIIILDEQQDMINIFYHLVKKLLNDNLIKDPILCLFGDVYQNIYQFNNSDERYLALADKLFNTNHNWVRLNMSISYRLTDNIAKFVNNTLLSQNRIKTIKSGPKVSYVICDMFNQCIPIIMKYIKKYKPDDIFILAPSVRVSPRSPLGRIENFLVKNKVPCHVAISDDTKLDERLIKNKLTFSTFHQVKGLERKIVFVLNFDDSYFEYYGKGLEKTKCPNTIYVACTRALDELIVFHDYGRTMLEFLNTTNLSNNCNLIRLKNNKLKESNDNETVSNTPPKKITVSALIRHLSNDIITNLSKSVTYKEISGDKPLFELNNMIKNFDNTLYENINDITGIVLPAIYEGKTKSEISYLNDLELNLSNLKNMAKYMSKLKKILFNYNNGKILEIADLLYAANIYLCYQSSYLHKMEQIKTYNWLSKKDIALSFKIMKNVISKKAEYEIPIYISFKNYISISGRIDIIDNETLWEIKCTSDIKFDHILQLLIYAYITKQMKEYDNIKHYKLLYILLNKIVVLEYPSDTEEIIDYLIQMKYENKNKINDETFIKNCLENKIIKTPIVRNIQLGDFEIEEYDEVNNDECDFSD